MKKNIESSGNMVEGKGEFPIIYFYCPSCCRRFIIKGKLILYGEVKCDACKVDMILTVLACSKEEK